MAKNGTQDERRISIIKRKGLISALLAVVLIVGMTGCDKNGGENFQPESYSSDSQNISTDNSIGDFKPVPVPEGGWTAESVTKTICIDGKPLEYPFTIGCLGKDFTINENDTQIFESGAAGTILYKDDIPILTIEFQNITSYDQINSTKPYGFYSYYKDRSLIKSEEVKEIVSINGVQLGETKDEIKTVFGNPNRISDDGKVLSYFDNSTGEVCLSFWLNENDELYSFTICSH